VMSAIFQVIQNVIVTVVGVAGLAFGFYKYWKSRETKSNLQCDVGVETFPVASKTLVDLSIQIKNPGKAAVYVTSAKVKEALCSVRKIGSGSI